MERYLRSNAVLHVLLLICILFSPVVCEAVADDIERDLQKNLRQSKVLVEQIKTKLTQGASVTDELTQLKTAAENVKINNLLLEERFKLREEKIKGLGSKAAERHQAMAEGYKKAIKEYLEISSQLSAVSGQEGSSQQLKADSYKLKAIESLLDRIIPKKPIIGSLPYKHLNYPAIEPSTAPTITPAYQGGNKVVSPDDLKSADLVHISKTIADFAQSLKWRPVAIYEHIKNTIETEWSWGCRKTPEETLFQKSGNSCEQAVLLASLLRASGFPTRIIQGNIEFFAGRKAPITKIQNLTGIDDPAKIAEFFQKAGIPFKPIIAGGKIVNFQIEHIWIESFIPYANYRGAIIDEQGKVWLGLDTSIKIEDYVYNNPKDIFQQSAVSEQLSVIRDEYLGLGLNSQPTTTQPATPLEYLRSRINSELTTQNSQLTYNDFLQNRTLPEDHMKILPDSMQFEQRRITNEYTEIPDELIHKVRFTARRQNTVDSIQGEALFDITLPLYKLSNQQVVVTYEPETVQDQEIIDSYGGLDNTPSYLVRLRPVLKINNERIIVAQDGLPMGADYNLTIELYSPSVNEGATPAETITNTLITGNLSVIGIVAQKAVSNQQLADSSKLNAESLLFQASNHYIDRWNQAEEELASLLHLTITRPLPNVVTVGGIIDVSYLLDMPHGFTWKGVYVDADMRSIEAVSAQQSALSGQPIADSSERVKLLMQLSSLQGSVLENRIFEDDFKVESISTAKMIQASNQQSAVSNQLFTIDKANIDTILPTLSLADNIKEDITNSVNQNLVIRFPQADSSPLIAISYKDWSGIGYLKENPDTGESGWMLSGMIAGGMTTIKKEEWIDQDLANTLNLPSSGLPNTNPVEATTLVRLKEGDYKEGTAGEVLGTLLQVQAQDISGKPVKDVPVTFTITAGGGLVQGVDRSGMPVYNLFTQTITPSTTFSLKTGYDGIARARLILGKHTSESPYYIEGMPYLTQAGLNLVTVSAQAGVGTIYTDKPFEAYGLPGPVNDMEIVYGNSDETNGKYVISNLNTFSGTLIVNVIDTNGNPISNSDVTYTVQEPTFLGTSPTGTIQNAKMFKQSQDCPGLPTLDTCQNVTSTFSQKTAGGRATAYVILGNVENTMYTITATTQKIGLLGIPVTISKDFHHYSQWLSQYRIGDRMIEPMLSIGAVHSVDKNSKPIDAGAPGQTINTPLTANLHYIEEDYEVASSGSSYYLKGKGTYRVIPVTNAGESTTMVTNGKVDFTISAGGGTVVPLIQNIQDPNEHINGKYDAQLTLGQEPAKNIVIATGSAKAYIPKVNSQTGEVYREEKPFWSSNNKPTTTFAVWGVKATIEPNQLIVINTQGYPTADTTIRYSITPTDYTPWSRYLFIYENETWIGLIPPDKNGNFILSQGGAKFDTNKTYYVQLVLNSGSAIEIVSEKVLLPIGQIQLLSNDGTDTPMQGVVTDGAATLKLQLTIKNGWQTITNLNWSIADALVSGATSSIKGTLLDENGDAQESLPVVFNNGVATATYRAPETFVRYGADQTQTIEAQDKELAERTVQITLNGQAVTSPAIRLKRPPVVLVHGLWGSGNPEEIKNRVVPYSWKAFSSMFNEKNFFSLIPVDYEDCNACDLDTNNKVIKLKGINIARSEMMNQGFAATKVDIVSHSMGGLLIREYCKNNGDYCNSTIRKIITIDTPHLGSELASLINVVQQQQGTTCYGVLAKIDRPGRRIWQDIQRTTLQGALVDLAVGSDALNNLSSTMTVPVTAISGATNSTGWAYDNGLFALWGGLWLYCNRVPDAGYVGSHPDILVPVFSGVNDRIVSINSQLGFGDEQMAILNVDHSTVLREMETITRVKEILENP